MKVMMLPFMYFLCQSDLSPWAVSRDQIDRFSKENGFTGWTETSVKENRNINEAMRWVALSVLGPDTQSTVAPWAVFSDFWSNKYRSSPWNVSLPKILEDAGCLSLVSSWRAAWWWDSACRITFFFSYLLGLISLLFSFFKRVLVEKMMNNSREDVMSLSTQGNYINLQTKPSSGWTCC